MPQNPSVNHNFPCWQCQHWGVHASRQIQMTFYAWDGPPDTLHPSILWPSGCPCCRSIFRWPLVHAMHLGRVSGIHIHYGKQFVVWNHPVSGKNIGLDPDVSYVPGDCEQLTQSSDKKASPWRFEHVLPPYLVHNENWWERKRERYIYNYIYIFIYFYLFIFIHIIF